MGLAPMQRKRFPNARQLDRCLGACPTFPTDQPRERWSARKGARKGTGTVTLRIRAIPQHNLHGASPLSRWRF